MYFLLAFRYPYVQKLNFGMNRGKLVADDMRALVQLQEPLSLILPLCTVFSQWQLPLMSAYPCTLNHIAC